MTKQRVLCECLKLGCLEELEIDEVEVVEFRAKNGVAISAACTGPKLEEPMLAQKDGYAWYLDSGKQPI